MYLLYLQTHVGELQLGVCNVFTIPIYLHVAIYAVGVTNTLITPTAQMPSSSMP